MHHIMEVKWVVTSISRWQLYMSDIILYSMELEIRLIIKEVPFNIRTLNGTKTKLVNKNNPAHSSGFNRYLASKTLENKFSENSRQLLPEGLGNKALIEIRPGMQISLPWAAVHKSTSLKQPCLHLYLFCRHVWKQKY